MFHGNSAMVFDEKIVYIKAWPRGNVKFVLRANYSREQRERRGKGGRRRGRETRL